MFKVIRQSVRENIPMHHLPLLMTKLLMSAFVEAVLKTPVVLGCKFHIHGLYKLMSVLPPIL